MPTVVAAVAAALLCAASFAAATDPCIFSSGDDHFDLSPLKKSGAEGSPNWLAREDDTPEAGRANYIYYFNICGPVHNIEGVNDTEAGIVQEDTENDNTYIVGSATGAKIISQHSEDLRYLYKPVTTNGFQRDAVISLTCADGIGAPVFFDEIDIGQDKVSHPKGGGTYIFVWPTCAACPLGSPRRTACPSTVKPSRAECDSYTKELGKAVLIAFLGLLAAGFLIATAYKRLIQGAKGIEQIPFIDFWRNICCCGGASGGYSNVADDDGGAVDSDRAERGMASAAPAPVPAAAPAPANVAADDFSEDDDMAMLDA